MKQYTIREIDVLISRAHRFYTEREKDFLQSVRKRVVSESPLSYAQNSWIKSLSDKYSLERIEEERAWILAFDDDKRDVALKVATYYDATQGASYFIGTVSKVLANPKDFVLTKTEWDKFCENKYALKIRKIYEQEPKFKKADCIQIRAANRIDLANTLVGSYPNRRARYREANKIGFVLEVNARPVTRAAKGSRIYKILLTGDTSPIYAHESDLKRKR